MRTRPVNKSATTRPIRLPFRAPPRAWALAEWSLLPLRAFLGFTFLYASLQKLANPDFIHSASGISIQNQLRGAVHTSPIGALIRPFVHIAVPIGIFIAVAEVAVGVGTLLGLWGRLAACGGALLSLILFLTVSFHQTPWFTGADIVYLFAWTPLILAGSGTRLSMDALLARRAAHGAKVPDPELVVMPFVQVQKLCGHFDNGRCRVQKGAPCQPHGCPVLEGPRPSLLTRGAVDHVDRRSVLLGAARSLVVGGVTAAAALVTGGIGWALHKSTTTTTTSTTTTTTTTTPRTTTTTTPRTTTTTLAAPSGTDVGKASQIPVGQGATLTLANGDPGIVICVRAGEFVCYDTVCPHAGCTVGYSANASILQCPCHSSQFEVATGARISGPAPSGLTAHTVVEGPNGDLYVS